MIWPPCLNSICGLTSALYNGMINVFSIYVMFLLISPNIWLPFAAASPHCSETFMSALTVTPRSFSFTLVPNIVLPIKYSPLTCPMWMHLHLPKLNNICHFSDQFTNLVRSSYTVSLSASVFTVLNTFVSSANLNTLHDKSSSKSFINIKHNMTPMELHSKLVSSMISPPLLLFTVFCLSTMLVSNWSYFPLYHRLLI